jgi:hypothetical protein
MVDWDSNEPSVRHSFSQHFQLRCRKLAISAIRQQRRPNYRYGLVENGIDDQQPAKSRTDRRRSRAWRILILQR